MADPSAAERRRRVLVVDADPSFAGSLALDFEERGFEVETAGSVTLALTRLTGAPLDLVVLDPLLTDRAALELIRACKMRAPELAVILVSGSASLSSVVDAMKEGARGFFTKPVRATAILDDLEDRRPSPPPYISPLLLANHELGSAALNVQGVDRFFAISPGLLCVVGFDGYLKMLNPAWEKVLGYTIDELCARPYLELVHPDDREKATDEALELCGGQTVFHFKNRYRCKDGSFRWLAWSATPSPAHRLIYASARDVTKTVRMERGLRDSNKRLQEVVASSERLLRETHVENETLVELARYKDEVSAMIVHDLKNPLAVIVANYDYILEGFEGSDDCLEALQDSQVAGQRMLMLLSNLIDNARLENGTLVPAAAEVALPRLLRSIAEQRRVLARRRAISIVLAPGPDLTAAADADLVTRTLENILDNALRHTPDGGSIEMELREAVADVEIRISNSGSAVPIGMRERIFDKYERSSAAPGTRRMNLGLGLYFCRLAIEAQGGGIWVEETERLPAVFGIRLPRHRAGGEPGTGV